MGLAGNFAEITRQARAHNRSFDQREYEERVAEERLAALKRMLKGTVASAAKNGFNSTTFVWHYADCYCSNICLLVEDRFKSWLSKEGFYYRYHGKITFYVEW